MKKIVILLLLIFLQTSAKAENYRFITPEDFKKVVESGKKIHIIDLQKKEEYLKKHIKNSIPTDSYPVKTEDEKQKLNQIIDKVKKDNLDIVIVCPRGGGAAKNAYDYMKSKGIEESRLYILEGGIKGFPYGEMCEKK